MARKGISKRATSPSPEETAATEKEKPRTLLIPALWLCGALVMLGIGTYALITGSTLLVEEKNRAIPPGWSDFIGSVLVSVWLFSSALESYSLELKRRVGAFLTAPLFLCGGLALLAYDVYGLATNNLRMLFLGKVGSGGIFLYGPPVWALFLAYLSLSVGLIATAAAYWMKSDNEALSATVDKVIEKAFLAALILYIGAAVLANKMNLHH